MMKRCFFRGNLFAGAVLVLALAGCKTSGGGKTTPPTSSGLPEVTLRAKAADDIKTVASEFFRNRGYVDTNSRHRYELVFDKPTKSGRSAKALRVRLRLYKKSGDTWRFVGTPLGVEGWRSDLESEVVLPQGANQIQAFLDEIKKQVETGR
jgi:hypothetical protein